MLVQAHARRKGKVWANPDEHSAPLFVIHVKVVLHDPALRDLQMPPILFRVADCDHDAGGFTRFHNDDYLIGFSSTEIALNEIVPSAFRRFQDGGTPFL
jgi:hypothetical protein